MNTKEEKTDIKVTREINPVKRLEIRYLSQSGSKVPKEAEATVLQEHQIDVFVNEKYILRCICTPVDLEELILGRLLSEGIIDNVNSIETLCISQNAERVNVIVNANCSMRNETAEKHIQEKWKPLLWKSEWIFMLAEECKKDTYLHKLTECTHSCLLAKEDKILYKAEDIGRHNAFDKAIGWALKNGVSVAECIFFTSGRVPADMMRKAVNLGIGLLASNSSVTAEAVELAKANHITLIGGLKRGRLILYAGSFAAGSIPECRSDFNSNDK